MYTSTVMAGGDPNPGTATDQVIRTKDGSTFDQMASLPVATWANCLVIVDDSTLFVTGGKTQSGSMSAGTFLYTRYCTFISQSFPGLLYAAICKK